MAGTVLTVASGKGGVGKTTTAVNLAVALWTDGNAVAVVDADLGMANLAAVLGLEPETTLHDVLAGRATLDEALVEAKDGDLLVLPGERDLAGFAEADPAELGAVLAELAERCDYVVVDTGAGLSYEDVLPLGLADEVVLVATPDPAAVGDTRKTLQISGLLDGPVRGVVVTRATDDTDAEAVASEIGVELLGAIPEDPAVMASTKAGSPLASHAPESPATAAYGALATAIQGGTRSAAGASAPEADASDEDDGTEPSDVAALAGGEDETAEDDAPEPASPEADADGEDEPEEGSAVEPEDAAVEEDGEAPDAADVDEPAAEAEDVDESTDAPDDGAKRGGLTGWLGRLFS